MSGSRRKWIEKLVEKRDLNLLISLRRCYGDATVNMTEEEILKKAKKLWSRLGLKEKWGC